ncbi:hypothetical protein NDU88_006655 [Pleurodeles waltl]|uniref:Uncharacterized protein n=1 Tax=Pleurodeles waltl TaxID=8319 RepID=A0AAV7RMV2_PLEWA|nr:hypothetical protein NDU88_006655 [Pleurodeles waltl]
MAAIMYPRDSSPSRATSSSVAYCPPVVAILTAYLSKLLTCTGFGFLPLTMALHLIYCNVLAQSPEDRDLLDLAPLSTASPGDRPPFLTEFWSTCR